MNGALENAGFKTMRQRLDCPACPPLVDACVQAYQLFKLFKQIAENARKRGQRDCGARGISNQRRYDNSMRMHNACAISREVMRFPIQRIGKREVI